MDGRSERRTTASTVEVATASLKRISWGAVFAGTVVTIVVWMTLALLGMAIGLATVDPGDTPGQGIATGAMIWWIISSLVALFFGAWVAGRLAGPQRRLDGALHGMATWGVSALVTVFMLTSTVGALMGGAFGIVGNVMQSSSAPAMMRMLGNYDGGAYHAGDYRGRDFGRGGYRADDNRDRDWDNRGAMDRDRDQARSYSDRDYSANRPPSEPSGSMSSGATGRRSATDQGSSDMAGRVTTGTGTSGMGTMDRETDRTSTMGTGYANAEADIRREAHQLVQANRSTTTPGAGSMATGNTAQIDQTIDMMVTQARTGADRIDREAVTNILVTTAGLSPSDARATVDRWVDRLHNLRGDDTRATTSTVANRTEEVAQNAANIASKAAMWSFIMLLLGLGAALLGGAAGSPRDIAIISATAATPPPPPAAL